MHPHWRGPWNAGSTRTAPTRHFNGRRRIRSSPLAGEAQEHRPSTSAGLAQGHLQVQVQGRHSAGRSPSSGTKTAGRCLATSQGLFRTSTRLGGAIFASIGHRSRSCGDRLRVPELRHRLAGVWAPHSRICWCFPARCRERASHTSRLTRCRTPFVRCFSCRFSCGAPSTGAFDYEVRVLDPRACVLWERVIPPAPPGRWCRDRYLDMQCVVRGRGSAGVYLAQLSTASSCRFSSLLTTPVTESHLLQTRSPVFSCSYSRAPTALIRPPATDSRSYGHQRLLSSAHLLIFNI
jgi:hypothetical protein